MSWIPDGETRTEERLVTKEELEVEYVKHPTNDLRRFIDSIREGDVILYQSESNKNRGYARYVGRNGSYQYSYMIYTRMS